MKNAPNLNLTARSDTPRAAEPIALTAEQIHLVSGGLNRSRCLPVTRTHTNRASAHLWCAKTLAS